MKVLSIPISVGSAKYALWIMERSRSFSPEVKEWAGKAWKMFNYTTLDMPKFRDLMRQWWRENESHFAARNYKAVKPGGSWAGVVKPATYYEGETVIQLPSESPTPSSEPPQTTVSTEPRSGHYIVPALVFGSAMAIAAALFLRRKKSA